MLLTKLKPPLYWNNGMSSIADCEQKLFDSHHNTPGLVWNRCHVSLQNRIYHSCLNYRPSQHHLLFSSAATFYLCSTKSIENVALEANRSWLLARLQDFAIENIKACREDSCSFRSHSSEYSSLNSLLLFTSSSASVWWSSCTAISHERAVMHLKREICRKMAISFPDTWTSSLIFLDHGP